VAIENYSICLELILHHEGGYVNHPKDPGGITNMGITKRVFEKWIGYEVTADGMKALTVEDVEPIYKKKYWDRVKGDEIETGLDLCVFDFAVNAGTGRAAKYLQKMVGTTQDGAIGPATLKHMSLFIQEEGVEAAIQDYQSARQSYYESLSIFETFGRGWTRRVTETTEAALKMV